uniref:DUF3989 domain-containing protein n=1 Tax=Heterorhabditis bacteriophora TaxID=37862 RepID=A0A1I7X117_HETBA
MTSDIPPQASLVKNTRFRKGKKLSLSSVICSFVLAVGAVLICITSRTTDNDGELKGSSAQIVRIIGILMTLVGGLGYTFTIYEVLKRAHEKLSQGKLRKLEEQVEKRRRETMRKEIERRDTLWQEAKIREEQEKQRDLEES